MKLPPENAPPVCAELEQQLMRFAASAPGFMFTTRLGPDGVLSMPFASVAIQDFFGLRPADVADSIAPILARIHPDDQARVAETIQNSGRTLSLCNVEFRAVHPEKGEIWLEARSMPVRAEDGSILWHGLMIDITRRKQTEQRLQQALEFTEGIVNAIPDLLFEIDLNGRYLNIWAQNPQLLAAQKEMLLGNTIGNMLPPAAAEVTMSALREADEKGYSFGKVIQLNVPHGEHWFELSASKKQGSDTAQKSFILLSRDVTERKLAMESLQRSQASLAEAQRIGQMGNWELDLVSGVLSWSDEIFRIFEIDPARFGASYEAFLAAIHPDDRAALDRAYNDSLAKRMPYDFEHRLLLADGRIKYVRERCETYFDTQGRPLRSHGTVQDITVRRQADELLHRRAEEFRALSENSPDIIVRYDRHLRRLYVNPAFEKLCGLPAKELVGKQPVETSVLPREEALRLQGVLAEVLTTGHEASIELSWHTPAGQPIFSLMRAVPEFDPHGKAVSVLSVARDITALKEIEHSLAESRARLREVAIQRNAEYEEERKRLASEVHEGVGQYLMAMRLNLSILESQLGTASPAALETIRKMFGFVDKSTQLVRQVTSDLRPRVLDLGIVTALEWLTNEFSAKHDTYCELRIAEKEYAMDERTEIVIFRVVEEALANIANQAEAEQVKILLERRGDDYVLKIYDNGKGFDLESLYKNKMVGFDWMREQVTALGGDLAIARQPQGGTAIEVRIPAQDTEK